MDKAFCGRLIRPFPTSPVSKSSLFLSLRVCRRSSLLTRERGRGWARSHIIRPRENLALYLSFKTLWIAPKEKRRKGVGHVVFVLLDSKGDWLIRLWCAQSKLYPPPVGHARLRSHFIIPPSSFHQRFTYRASKW